MRHKLVRAVRLMAFVTTAIEKRAGFVLLKVRATGMTVEIGGERKLVTGAPGKKNDHTARRIAMNEDLDVPTHSERSSSLRDRRYECTRIVASETLRVSCLENFKAGALGQNVRKITIIHLKDPRR